MKIGIIGSGIVGRVLGAAFLKEGHSVMLGSRNTAKPELTKWQQENPSGQTGDFDTTARYGDLLVLATGGAVTEAAVKLAGIDNFFGKTVIDATNPIAPAPPEDGVLSFFTGPNESLMEKLQALLPEAHLVKAFNSVGNGVMYQPDYKGIRPTMFICGNNDLAKAAVAEILTGFGWESADMGKAIAARAIEPLCILWCITGFRDNHWTHAFKLLK